jgi:hypothetical protein
VSSPTWGSWPDIYYCLTVTVLFLWGALSDERTGLSFASAVFLGSESHGTRDHILLSQIWDFPFRCLLRLAGSRWRYSTLPPHGSTVLLLLVLIIWPRHGLHRKRLFHYSVFSSCQGNNVTTELFPSNGCCTAACLHSCYLATGLRVTVCAVKFSLNVSLLRRYCFHTNAPHSVVLTCYYVAVNPSVKKTVEEKDYSPADETGSSSTTRWLRPWSSLNTICYFRC